MKALRAALVLSMATATSWSQNAPRRSPTPPAVRGNRLTQAAAAGVLELSRARLDSIGDMATTDLADGAEPAGDIDTTPLGPTEAPWSQCALEGAVHPVDLRASGLTPLQVVLTSNGTRAVAMVVMGRPGGGRRGMLYPESRWIEWDGARTALFPGPGVLPDAALVIDGPEVGLFAYAARDGSPAATRGESLTPAERVVAYSRIVAGRINGGPRALPGSEGLDIDTAPVRWDGGIAVVLGRDNPAPGNVTRTELLFAVDHRGRPLGTARPLSQEVSASGAGGRYVDLASSPGGERLVGAWVVRDGPRAGLWVERDIDPTQDPNAPATTRAQRRRRRLQRPLRLLQGGGYWGPVVGERGVLVRREHEAERGAGLADLLFTSWTRNAPTLVQRVLGSFWDAVPAWSARGLILAGLRPGAGEDPDPVVAFGAGDRGSLRTFATRDAETFDALRDAVDIAIAPVPDGAVIAWIDGQSADDDPTRRRLRIARIACRAAAPTVAAPAAPARPPARPATTTAPARRPAPRPTPPPRR